MSFLDHIKRKIDIDTIISNSSWETIKRHRGPREWRVDRPTQQIFAPGKQRSNDLHVSHISDVYFHPNQHIYDNGAFGIRLALITQGKGWSINKHGHYPLKPGMFLTRMLKEDNDLIITGNRPLRTLLLAIHGNHAKALHKQLFAPHGIATVVNNFNEMVQLYEQINREAATHHEQTQARLACLVEYFLRKIDCSLAADKTERTQAHSVYIRCRQYMHDKLTHLRHINEVADHCHIDPSYLSRLFKRYEGMSPRDYLAHLKISRAADLLIDSDKSVKEIAAEMNFSDAFTFSRAFKRLMNRSPKQYRDGK